MNDFDEIVAPSNMRAALVRAGVTTRYPEARRTRMRLGGILIDYVQIHPRDLTVGTRVIVRDHRDARVHVIRHVVELHDARTPDAPGRPVQVP